MRKGQGSRLGSPGLPLTQVGKFLALSHGHAWQEGHVQQICCHCEEELATRTHGSGHMGQAVVGKMGLGVKGNDCTLGPHH